MITSEERDGDFCCKTDRMARCNKMGRLYVGITIEILEVCIACGSTKIIIRIHRMIGTFTSYESYNPINPNRMNPTFSLYIWLILNG